MTRFIHHLLCSTVLGLIVLMPQTAWAQEIHRDVGPALRVDDRPFVTALPGIEGSLSSFVRGESKDASTPARKVVDKRFAGLGVALFGSMTLDTYSTFKSSAWCPSCRESNPYVAPFVSRGPAATYSAGLLFDAGVLSVSGAMRKSWNPAIRRIWWAPAVALIIGHNVATYNNYALRHSCQRDPRCRY